MSVISIPGQPPKALVDLAQERGLYKPNDNPWVRINPHRVAIALDRSPHAAWCDHCEKVDPLRYDEPMPSRWLKLSVEELWGERNYALGQCSYCHTIYWYEVIIHDLLP